MSEVKLSVDEAVEKVMTAVSIHFTQNPTGDIRQSLRNLLSTPRPLSKGEWVMIGDRLHLVIDPDNTEEKGLPIKTIKVDGGIWWHADSTVVTPIDTLTEEHLKMLGDEYTIRRWGDEEYQVWFKMGCRYMEQRFQARMTIHEAISECLKSVISRRRLDREMGE